MAEKFYISLRLFIAVYFLSVFVICIATTYAHWVMSRRQKKCSCGFVEHIFGADSDIGEALVSLQHLPTQS